MCSDRTPTGHRGEIPDELRRAWAESTKLHEQLTQAQQENGKLREENAELKERLDAITENFREKATMVNSVRKAIARRNWKMQRLLNSV